MAVATTSSQCLIHGVGVPTSSGMQSRCRCQAVQGYQPRGRGTTARPREAGPSSIGLSTLSVIPSSHFQTLPPGQRQRGSGGSNPSDADIETRVDQRGPQPSKSRSETPKLIRENVRGEVPTSPDDARESVGSIGQQYSFPGYDDKHEEEHIASNQCHRVYNLGKDFTLYDEDPSRHMCSVNPARKSATEDEDEIMESIEIDNTTDLRKDTTPHLRLPPPPPRPRRLSTPDFSDNEKTTNFFESLEILGERHRRGHVNEDCK